MTPERWRRVRELLDEAIERPAATRAAFLAQAAAGDPDLRAEVDSLLASYDESEDFLAEPPARLGEVLGTGAGESLEGAGVGPYRLLTLLRAEGASPVYSAVAPGGGRVAIKLVPPGLDSLAARQRILGERQTLAALDHPGVLRAIETGVAQDGRPYLVVELFEGSPIDRWCDERRLPIDERLRLFVSACDAVQHAHWRLVIHLAVGTQSLLVDERGALKLVDFGVASPLRLAEAAPEAGREPLSTAVDVNALGVVLYRLLCGRWPGTAPEPPSRALFRDEPPQPESIAGCRDSSPEALARRLSGDLDSIALLALGHQAGHRYPTARVLSDDLERHLGHLPVRARGRNPAYLLERMMARGLARARALWEG